MKKTVLITGCGPGGIGSALAKEFYRSGCHVIATGRTAAETDPELLRTGQEEKNSSSSNGTRPRVDCLELDVTSDSSIAAAVAAVETLFPDHGLDILVNNAGICTAGAFADTTTADLQKLLDVNVIGVWAVTRAFLPLLRRASEARGGDSVVANLCSINEHMAPPFLAAYNATKGFLTVMSRTIRRELAPFGIRVVMLKTGAVKTAMQRNGMPLSAKVPEGSWYAAIRDFIEGWRFMEQGLWMEAEDYARGVVRQLLQEKPPAVVWRGGLALITRLISWFGWETVMDPAMIRGTPLHTLKHTKQE